MASLYLMEDFNALSLKGDVVRCPESGKRINKSECCYSCDTPDSPGGVFVNLRTFRCVGQDFLSADASAYPVTAYLSIRRVWEKNPAFEAESVREDTLSELAAAAPRLSQRVHYGIVLIEGGNPAQALPLLERSASEAKIVQITDLVELGLIEPAARCLLALITCEEGTNAGFLGLDEELRESRFAQSLQQIENPPKVGYGNWKCQECGRTENLWMHLADGYIGCGRKQYGVDDSGCLRGQEGAAVKHWQEDKAGRPLAVKLGTITPASADVYSYAEDDMVLDPLLDQHLAHFGINTQLAEKSQMTLAEQQVKCNKTFDWSRITEEGAELQLLTGTGHVGMVNLGSTCYMNSVVQVLTRLPMFASPFIQSYERLFLDAPMHAAEPEKDLGLQLAKVLHALTSDRYLEQRESIIAGMNSTFVREAYLSDNPCVSVSPAMLRRVVVTGHREFAQLRQQDAEEFLLYFLDKLDSNLDRSALRGSATHLPKSQTLFDFQIEKKLHPANDQSRVRLTSESERILSLCVMHVDEDSQGGKKITNYASLDDALGAYTHEENLSLPGSGETSRTSCALSRRFRTFPEYLLIQLKRFTIGPSWEPVKLTHSVKMPEFLDLSCLRAKGLVDGETVWGEEEDSASLWEGHARFEDLQGLGFEKTAAAKALTALGSEASLERLIDYLDVQKDPAADPKESESIKLVLQEMGGTSLQIDAAIATCGADVEAAANWMFTEGLDLSELELRRIVESSHLQREPAVIDATFSDGAGKYDLAGFVSHMGNSTSTGHYVAHFREWNDDGSSRWVIANDTKVAVSSKPPFDLGYLYFYRRSHDKRG